MDIHRCRFVPYNPAAINAIAFSHPKTRSAIQASLSRVAIGRANGSIEIWNPANGAWNQEMVIPGGKDRSVDGLVWVNEPDQDLGDGRIANGKLRLFSIGYTSTVTEWDLDTGKPKRHASGQHGDIWCIAAQPAPDKPQTMGGNSDAQASTKLVVGTIDGELIMYSIADDDLRFQRVLVRSPKKAQMTSITFQSRKTAIVGCSDSTIRVYDIQRGHMMRRMALGSDLVGGAKDIIVWSVKCLPNGNIVSGDSTGHVCIWDGKTFTQTQRIHSHKQDVLSLATNAEGTSIISGGMDRRTILYRQGAGHRWTKVWGRRYHEHDVKALATYESGNISVVMSGGPDTNPVLVPLKTMGRDNHRKLSGLPQQPPVIGAPKARFIVSWWEREVHIWVLRKSYKEIAKTGDESDFTENSKLLKTIVVKGESNITSATINPEGTFLVVSTAIDVKAFKLEHQDPVKPSDVKLSTVELPQNICNLGATQVQLSPNSDWLSVIQECSKILLARVETTEGAISVSAQPQRPKRLTRNVPRYVKKGGLGKYDRTITRIAFSPDSKMLAVSDLTGYVDTWALQGEGEKSQNGSKADEEDDAASSESDSSDDEAETPVGDRWIRNPNAKLLPKLQSAATVLSFSGHVPDTRPSEENGESDIVDDYTLLAITSSWHISLFHPTQGCLTAWSRQNPRKALPLKIQELLDLVKGAVWQGSRVWLYGVSFLVMLDLSHDLPRTPQDNDDAAAPETLTKPGMKRKRTTGAGGKMQIGNITPHQILKLTSGKWKDIDVDDESRHEDGSDEDMEEARDGELAELRNGPVSTSTELTLHQERQNWLLSFKYRPILGIVPFLSEGKSLEVALIERRTKDLDMQEKYFELEQWER